MTDLTSLFEDDLPPINQMLESKSPQEIIEWAFSIFPRIGLLTSGQKAGSVLAKIIFSMDQIIDLVFADTGVLFPETLETIEKIHQTYHFPLIRYTPQLSIWLKWKTWM